MKTYHGTSKRVAQEIFERGVNVSIGGGELGKGFYTGEHVWEAKAWAIHVSGDKTENVVSFESACEEIVDLEVKLLDENIARLVRSRIKQEKATREYCFGVDLVWSPIVGSDKVDGDQFKWESNTAEQLLNEKDITKKKII